MFLFEKRIYTLNIKKFTKYSYYFYLLNHIGNEMIKQASLNDIKITRVRSKYVSHRSKLYVLTSNVLHKTFDYNNYTNMLIKNGVTTSVLYHITLYCKYTGANVKNTMHTLYMFFNKCNTLVWETVFTGISIHKLKLYIIYAIFFQLFFAINTYITVLNSNIYKQKRCTTTLI